MYLREHRRKKNGKAHRYWSVVEGRRLTAREALASLGAIQMVDVDLPTTDGCVLVLPRYTEPETEQELLLAKLDLSLPARPLPRIRAVQLQAVASSPGQ